MGTIGIPLPTSPVTHPPALQPSPDTTSLCAGGEWEVTPLGGALLPFCTPLSTLLEKSVLG